MGSEKFWLTRPYDRVSLFAEKLLFVLLWAFLPMLLHDVFLIRHFGFSLSSALGLLLWKSAQFGFFLLVAATVAVLSASFARAVLLAIVAIIITALTFYIVMQNSGDPPVGSWTATLRDPGGACLSCRRRPVRDCFSVPFSDYIRCRSDRSRRHTRLRPLLALLAGIVDRLLVAKERVTTAPIHANCSRPRRQGPRAAARGSGLCNPGTDRVLSFSGFRAV